ncbi:hypothetical protein ACFWVC_05240 [Streptomyces sp. NPDC058691]|uniref:hypothetical protein n=1 Tax=Streptomyces sp. NPDC058691 TaxID=3346601 RepID=UPI0036592E8D
MEDTPFELPGSGTPDQAVIAHFRLGSESFGEPDERARFFDAQRAMSAAVEAARVGEVDGNEFGGGEAVLYAYGPDADALFKVMEPALRELAFRPAYVVLRRGDAGDAEADVSRVDL